MRNKGNHSEVIEAFFDNNDGPHDGGTVYFEGDTLYSYGHHFPLAYKHNSGITLFNGDRYSVTTSGHQSKVRSYQGNNDFTLSFEALGAAGIQYNDKRLVIIDAISDQNEDFKPDPTRYGKDARARKFIKEAPPGATIIYTSWEDDNGEKHTAPAYWHRSASALVKWKGTTKTETIYQKKDYGVIDWDKEPTYKKKRIPVKYFIMGMDEGNYFITELPRKAATIKEAFEILKPKAIRQAEAEGHQVRRQGEWFFYQIMEGKTAKEVYKQLGRNFNLTDASGDSDGAAHTTTRGGRLGGVAFKTIDKEQAISFGKMSGSQLIVSGQVRHSRGDHAQLSLSTTKDIKIFAAHINTGKASFSMGGSVD